MKGLLKGLRYISQIFDAETKEQEMQIGYPTDVKHVAHVGWDGPCINAPNRVNEFRSPSIPLTAPIANEIDGAQDTSAQDLPQFPARRSSRHNALLPDSPHQESRVSRRHQSSGAAAVDSLPRESSEGSRHSRRHRGTVGLRQESIAGRGGGGGLQSQDGGPGVPKPDHPRRKTKGSLSGGGSIRSTSRLNAVASESDGVVESQSLYSASSLTMTREEEGSDTIDPQEKKGSRGDF